MNKSKRISLNLFDDDLKNLINASAKIFPISENDIINNVNPNNYEYVRVGRKIFIWDNGKWEYVFIWDNGKWEYVIADDIDIKWTDVQEKPNTFTPTAHQHVVADIIDLIIDAYSKLEVDTKLNNKSNTNHSHDDLHNHVNKTLLDKLKETDVSVDYDLSLLNYVNDIKNGYTEGHTHNNLSVLQSLTQILIDKWNTVIDKSDKTHTHDDRYYTESEIDTKLSSKAEATTLSGHIGSNTIHVTQTDKNKWNNRVTVGVTKPTDGSIWYKEV